MKVTNIIAGMVVAVATVIAVNGVDASAASTQNCKFEYRGFGGQAYGLGQGFEKHPDVVSTGFWIKGDANCRMDITLTVWKIPHDTLQPYPEEEQVYFSHVTKKDLKPGFHVLATKVPDCYWQADLVKGTNPTGPNGRLPYEENRMINSTLGGDKKCEETPEEVPEETPVVTTTPEEPKKPEVVQAAVTPEALPATGPAAIATTFAGVTASAGAAHAIVRRLKRQ